MNRSLRFIHLSYLSLSNHQRLSLVFRLIPDPPTFHLTLPYDDCSPSTLGLSVVAGNGEYKQYKYRRSFFYLNACEPLGSTLGNLILTMQT